jgi:hypothetical protein
MVHMYMLFCSTSTYSWLIINCKVGTGKQAYKLKHPNIGFLLTVTQPNIRFFFFFLNKIKWNEIEKINNKIKSDNRRLVKIVTGRPVTVAIVKIWITGDSNCCSGYEQIITTVIGCIFLPNGASDSVKFGLYSYIHSFDAWIKGRNDCVTKMMA